MFHLLLFTILISKSSFVPSQPFDAYTNNVINHNLSNISLGHCQWLTKHCGISDYTPFSQSVMKIHGGQEAQLGQLPWVVYVLIQYEERIISKAIKGQKKQKIEDITETYSTTCAGTLVSNKHVLTAAHCLYDQLIKNKIDQDSNTTTTIFTDETVFKARLQMGDINLFSQTVIEREETGRLVSTDFLPEAEYAEEKLYDYAIIEFDPPIDEANMTKNGSTVRPACLLQHGLQIADTLLVAGWGETGFQYLPVKVELTFSDSTQTPIILRKKRVNKKKCPGGYYPLELCTTGGADDGDSGAGYIQEVNDRAIVVGVFALSKRFPNDTEYDDSGTLLIGPANDPGSVVGECVPMQWISENIWPKDTNCYADT